MELFHAVEALGALAQESRLKVFRLLVQSGSGGMAAGAIAHAVRVPHNTMSSHLGILSRAGLVVSRKEGRSIIYSVDLAGTRDLLSFLARNLGRSSLVPMLPISIPFSPSATTPPRRSAPSGQVSP
jgi:ArsR family transcriptional regulator, arsenate/arsenite/antimonite-responsive transcriptional repressor